MRWLHVCRSTTDFVLAEVLTETKVVVIGGFKIGLVHGHQVAPVGEAEALAVVQRQLDVEVLVSGHTHHNSIVEYEGKCYVNPGSITGAYTPTSAVGEVSPSFVLMNITEGHIDFFTYELGAAEKLKITKSTFAKPGSAPAPAT
jgi:vacuolar protein sorting-associated protein 29